MYKRLLVVDDDRDDTELFTEAVEILDSTVQCINAVHGKEALEKLTSDAISMPDIIFLDINMPVMDGWAFLEQMKAIENVKDIPVIMYSTSSEKSIMKTALLSGALCFFSKPESFNMLKSIMRVVLEHLHNHELDKVCEAIHKKMRYY
jgi:CheY-like chemotaxis protein